MATTRTRASALLSRTVKQAQPSKPAITISELQASPKPRRSTRASSAAVQEAEQLPQAAVKSVAGRKRKQESAADAAEAEPASTKRTKKASDTGSHGPGSRRGRKGPRPSSSPAAAASGANMASVAADSCKNQQDAQFDYGSAFDPSCHEHVVLVKNLLSLSGSRAFGATLAPAGRQQQYQQLHSSLAACCQAEAGRAVYISGLPGTGKSFTVQRVLSALSQEQHTAPISVTINCMALSDTRDVYASLLAECSQLGCKRGKSSNVGPALASTSSLGGADEACAALVSTLKALHKNLGASKSSSNQGHKSSPLVVLVLEEVDRLLGRGPDELYKLFMLPHTPGLTVALVAIANSLDLTERMLPALKCRGVAPDFVSFPAYSKSQVQTILTTTLEQLPWKVFEPAAVELVARTVSGTSGDLRQAFKVCRAALDNLAEDSRAAAAAATAAAATAAAAAINAAAEATTHNADAAGTDLAAGPAPAPPALRTTVGLKEMMPAIRSVSNATGASASSITTVRALPNQQQLVLLAASMVVAGSEAAAMATRECEEIGASALSISYAAATARRTVNPFAAQPVGPGGGAAAGPLASPAAASVGRPALPRSTPGTAARTAMTADAALRVPAREVYERYCGLCKELFMRPVALPEFCHTCTLLAEQALINVNATGGCTPGNAGRGRAGTLAVGGAQNMKLSLRVLAKDVRAALQSNPIYKKVIGAE